MVNQNWRRITIAYDKALSGVYKKFPVQVPGAAYLTSLGARVTSFEFADQRLEFGERVLENLITLAKSARKQHWSILTIEMPGEIEFDENKASILAALQNCVVDIVEHQHESYAIRVYILDQYFDDIVIYGGVPGGQRTHLHELGFSDEKKEHIRALYPSVRMLSEEDKAMIRKYCCRENPDEYCNEGID